MPDVETAITTTEMNDLFAEFATNWSTLSPVLWILYGILIGFFLLTILFKHLKGN